jgi:leucine dehydrogenase
VTLPQLNVRIVAGGANNQLARDDDANELRRRGILYAPDYVINAGGMIQLAAERLGLDRDFVAEGIRGIGTTLRRIFEQADADGVSTVAAANRLAENSFRKNRAPS